MSILVFILEKCNFPSSTTKIHNRFNIIQFMDTIKHRTLQMGWQNLGWSLAFVKAVHNFVFLECLGNY